MARDNDWKVGDVIYYRWSYSSHFQQEREIVGETSRSWLVLPVGAPAYQKDQTHRNWPQYCYKLPKSRKSKDGDIYEVGTKTSLQLEIWASKNRENIVNQLRRTHNTMLLRYVAKSLGMNDVVATYPTEGQ